MRHDIQAAQALGLLVVATVSDCRDCGKPVEALERFPKSRCLACHEKATFRGFTAEDVREALSLKR